MATQSLYRRYRPRRFAELKGQDHVVRALRTSVAEGREGQAYLFSGPRGTGKTTSARILAKVLNCENPSDGEPCCECESCLSVERGTSYDVHELDAASNNGVDSMRDLIEKASLGTPGRHKVYILDEVHMLSKAAEAALLKTLEEPPAHVVFVLATTDPQKMSDTIRSRTQHLQFHLLPADTLDAHVKWVAQDAGLEITDEAIEQVLAQGGGSARDTLSALELVANSGGGASDSVALDEFAEAMVERDPGRALALAAHAISRGRDARTLTEELIAFLRNGFLSLMAPDLVQLPTKRLDEVKELAARVGPAGLVRGIEQLGEALTEMRQAPDPRVLLDVAIVKLTSDAAGGDVGALTARLDRLERTIAEGGTAAASSGAGAAGGQTAPRVSAGEQAAATRPAADPTTGRAPLGGRAKRAAGSTADAPSDAPTAGQTSPPPSDSSPATSASGDPDGPDGPDGSGGPAPVEHGMTASHAGAAGPTDGDDTVPTEVPTGARPDVSDGDATVAAAASEQRPPATPSAPASDAPSSGGDRSTADSAAGGSAAASAGDTGPAGSAAAPAGDTGSAGSVSAGDWETVKASLRGIGRALFAPATIVSAGPGSLTLGLPNESHRAKCEQHRSTVEQALAQHVGSAVELELVVDDGDGGPAGGSGGGGPSGASSSSGTSGGGGGNGDARSSAPPAGSSASSGPDGSGPPDRASAGPPPDPAGRPVLRAVPDAASGRAIAENARRAGPAPDPDEMLIARAAALPDDDEIDLDDLVDAPPESVKSPIDRLAEAFPGSELIDDVYEA